MGRAVVGAAVYAAPFGVLAGYLLLGRPGGCGLADAAAAGWSAVAGAVAGWAYQASRREQDLARHREALREAEAREWAARKDGFGLGRRRDA